MTAPTCSVCKLPQFGTPAGWTCAQGHGGAPSVEGDTGWAALEAAGPVLERPAKAPGMAVQALAGEIVEALIADEKDGGYDLTAGMFGPGFSHLVRRWAAAEFAAGPAAPIGHIPADVLPQLAPPRLVLKQVPICTYAGVGTVPIYLAPPPAQPDQSSIHLQDLRSALAEAAALRQQLELLKEQQAGSIWLWDIGGQNDLASMGNRMGVLIYASDLRALLAARVATDDTHSFKNFHRSLSARFGYTHDDRDWRRDLVSLEEHIATLTAQAAQPAAPSQDVPDGYVLMPVDLTEYEAVMAYGTFLDMGWSQEECFVARYAALIRYTRPRLAADQAKGGKA